MLVKYLLFFSYLHFTTSQLISPCPDVLSYESRTRKEDQWYGVLSLRTPEDLVGVWITISLDRPVELLGNWFGEASSTDNKEFSIINQKYRLEAGPPVSVRFFVKYHPNGPIPTVQAIRLNGKAICDDEIRESTTPVLHLSHARPAQPRPSVVNTNNGNRSPSITSGGSINTNSVGHGSSSNRPISNSNVDTRRPTVTNNNSNNRNPDRNRPVGLDDDRIVFTKPTSKPRQTTSSDYLVPDYTSSTVNPYVYDYEETTRYRNDDRRTEQSIYNGGTNSVATGLNNNRNPTNYNDNDGADGINTKPTRRPNIPASVTDQRFSVHNDNNPDNSGYTNKEDESTFGNNAPRPSNNRPYNNNNGYGSSTEPEDEYFPGDFANLANGNNNNNDDSRPLLTPALPTVKAVGCGSVAVTSNARPLIAHGQDTFPGQWPWHAALYHSKGIQLTYSCGGSLVGDRYIVTAAHCVTKPHTNTPVNRKGILVYLGKYNLVTFGAHIQERNVEKIYIHPEYNYTSFFNDIAVLRLSKPVEITEYVRPICLWEGRTDLEDIVNSAGTVVGWGFDETRNLSNKLMQAQMPVVSTVKCIYSNRDFFSQFTFDKNYCAGFRNGTSVCNGDSGGGMVFPKKVGQSVTWHLRGLVSVGVALQGQGVCDPSQYIVFTDVAKHLRWVKQILSN